MTPEQRVQTKIIELLKLIPGLVYERRQAGGFNYRKGAPDIWAVYQGKHIEIEVKAPGGQPSSLQLLKEEQFTKAGALYWRGDNVKDFAKFIYTHFNVGGGTIE